MLEDYEASAQDVIRFADPFTDSRIKSTAKGIRIFLVRGGREYELNVDMSTGRVSSPSKKALAFNSINSLLASQEFADLPSLVRTQQRAYRAVKDIIPVSMRTGAGEELGSLSECFSAKASGLELFLLDGPAGIGKTFQIRRALQEQVERYTRGSAAPPVLHVSSQGRRLSNLSDVLARSTQDLGARFSGDQVSVLVKRGLLVVAIDGFDELVDADGYDDAWMALRNFVQELCGSGKVLLAARDTFVDEHELLQRIGENISNLKLEKIHLRPTDVGRAIDWLARSPGWKAADIAAPMTREVLVEGSYTLRPFFLKELREAKGWRDVIESGPRTFLIRRYLKRESDLIAQQLGGVKSVDVYPRLQTLFEEIALQMGEREVDWIELEHLRFMTEFAFDGLLDSMSVRKLAHKAGSFALLEISGTSHARSFSHSEVRSYFLALGALRSLAEGMVPPVMRRAVLNAEHMHVLAEVIESEPSLARPAIEALLARLNAEGQGGSFGSNAGAMAIVAAALGYVSRLDYLEVVDATFAGGAPCLLLNESHVSRLDATDCDMSRVELVDSRVDTLVVDAFTKLPRSLPGVREVELHSEGCARILRGTEIAEWLAEVAVSTAVNEDSPGVLLLQRLARRVIRHHYLREKGGNDEGSFMLQDANWPLVRHVLESHNRLEAISNKQMKGRSSLLFRILRPRELLDESNEETIMIVREIISKEKNQ